MTIYYVVCAHRPAPNPVMGDLTQFYTPCFECPGGVDGAKPWEYGPGGELTHPLPSPPQEGGLVKQAPRPIGSPYDPNCAHPEVHSVGNDPCQWCGGSLPIRVMPDPAAITARIHDEDE